MDEDQRSERLWELAADHSPLGMCLVSPNGELMTANRSLCAMLGRSEAELRRLTFQQITHPDDLESDLELVRQTLAGERDSYRLRKRYLHRGGSVVWCDLSAVLLRDEDGAPVHFISQIVDVTAQRLDHHRLTQAMSLIAHQRRTSRAILDTVDVGLVLLDSDGRYAQMNRRHADFFALAFPTGHHGMAGQLGDVFAADARTRLTREQMPSTRAVCGEELDDVRIWVGADPVTRRALSVSARTVRDTSGAAVGAALAYSDITELMRALQSRDDFVAAISHELRTPLTSVLGHLELLLESDDLPGALTRPLEVVRRNAERLRRLVSDLLETAQQRGGAVSLSRIPTDVAAMAVEAAESALPTARQAGIDLVVDVPGPVPAVVDPQRLRQVVDNLVSNAIKYTDAPGRVELRLQVVEDHVEITVTDTGMGIDAGDLELLFTPFFRGREARQRLATGVGLGLGIARSIIEAHDGRIEVDSNPGGGACFRVTLPRLTEGAGARWDPPVG